jgi:hypothetical protein
MARDELGYEVQSVILLSLIHMVHHDKLEKLGQELSSDCMACKDCFFSNVTGIYKSCMLAGQFYFFQTFLNFDFKKIPTDRTGFYKNQTIFLRFYKP